MTMKESSKFSNDIPNKMERITIMIPTLNEEKAIGKVLDELLELGFDAKQILIVDGGISYNKLEHMLSNSNHGSIKLFLGGRKGSV